MHATQNEQEMLENIRAMSAAEIEANALSDPDAQPLTLADFAQRLPLPPMPNATLLERFHAARRENLKKSLTVRYDADIVAWYKAKGKGYQKSMNAALRAVMEAEKQGLSY